MLLVSLFLSVRSRYFIHSPWAPLAQTFVRSIPQSWLARCMYSECTCCPPVAKFLLCVKPVWHKSCGMDVCHWEGARTAHLLHNSHNHASGSCQLRGSAARQRLALLQKPQATDPPCCPAGQPNAFYSVRHTASHLFLCRIAPAVPLLHPPQV